VTDEELDQAVRDVTPEMIDEALFAGSPDEICEQVRPLVERRRAASHHLQRRRGAHGREADRPRAAREPMRKLRRL
jgi:alkanesulfonate monooxygenase SsuD/methylene tetrahydromethanopterin reductase-like flavin-dependent oxidoreductase (luciferase family)